jgi:hypothetical protein
MGAARQWVREKSLAYGLQLFCFRKSISSRFQGARVNCKALNTRNTQTLTKIFTMVAILIIVS